MGKFILPGNQQMIQGIPVGKLNNLDSRVKALESGGASGGTMNKLTVSATPPIAPNINDLWYDIS